MIDVGVFAKVFAATSLEDTLDEISASGLRYVQFNMALATASSLPDAISPELAERIEAAFSSRGLVMAAVSGTFNMAHPDHRVRAVGLAALTELIAAAPLLGTRIVTLCTGSRDESDMWRAHPENGSAAAWADMLDTVARAVGAAEESGVTLAFEPEPNNVVADATAAGRLLREVSSPSLRVVMDAANLVVDGMDMQQATMDHAFELLGDDIVLAHAKDVDEGAILVAAGKGRLDYAQYVELLIHAGYENALILHGLRRDEVPASARFLRSELSALV